MVPETTIPACPGNCHHACARTHHVDVVVRWWAYIDNAWLEPWHPDRDLYYFHFRFFHVRLGRAETQYELNLSRSIAASGSAAPLRCCNRVEVRPLCAERITPAGSAGDVSSPRDSFRILKRRRLPNQLRLNRSGPSRFASPEERYKSRAELSC